MDWLGGQKKFKELKCKLQTVKEHISKFYPEESSKTEIEIVKPPKIFISHAETDCEYIKAFVELLEFIGIKSNQLFCSSVPGYDIPEGETIYEYLRQQFNQFDLHMFYMLSTNYYSSATALNEMGAAWILKKSYTTILLPDFKYQEIKGAVDPHLISASLSEDRIALRNHLSQIKISKEKKFGLEARPEARWDEKLDKFIDKINHIEVNHIQKNNTERKAVLKLAGIDDNGQISDTLQICNFTVPIPS